MARPFLIEYAVDGEKRISISSDEWPGKNGEFNISQIGAMCDEDSPERNLVVQISGVRFEFDRRYLGRIWPNLFKLNPPLLCARSDALSFMFPGRAIVVIAGAVLADVRA